MSLPTPGLIIERALVTYESQPGILRVVTGIAMGVAVTTASLGVFWLTLRILMDYFR